MAREQVGVAEYVDRRPLRAGAPLVEDEDPRAGLEDELEVVGRDDPGLASVAEAADEVLPPPVVEVVRRLIEEQDIGRIGEYRRESGAPALAAREVMRHALLASREPHLLERRRDPRPDLVPRKAEVEGTEGDIIVEGRAEELVLGLLEDEAQATPHGRIALAVEAAAEDEELAPGRLDETGDEVKERGLSGPVRAHEGEGVPGSEGKGH